MFSAWIIQVGLVVLLIAACSEEKGRPGARGGTEGHVMETGMLETGETERGQDSEEILVRFRDGVDEGTIARIQKEEELQTVRVVSRPALYLMKVVGHASVQETIGRLVKHGEVVFAEPNTVRRTDGEKARR